MKTLSIVLRSAAAVCFAFVMSSASCSLFDKVDDITFDVELTHEFTINETRKDKNVTYGSKEVLDAAKVNTDFAKYKDKIKSVTVTGVTYQVHDLTAGTTTIFTNGKCGFSAPSGSAATSVADLAIENIKAAEGQVKNLNYNQQALDEIGSILKGDQKVNVYVNGTFSETPVAFQVRIKLKATIVADAL
ncbi:MAG TPA: hypothetical protein VFE50_10030 [Cyclobacteriaceae bacterium]|nr:hypothetical protein [Cyclobacteriaceae bacterium]